MVFVIFYLAISQVKTFGFLKKFEEWKLSDQFEYNSRIYEIVYFDADNSRIIAKDVKTEKNISISDSDFLVNSKFVEGNE